MAAKTLDQVLSEVSQLVRDTLRDPSVQLKYETTARDVKKWDSLTHIEIVVAVEKHFGIKFNFAELQRFKNVGQMCDSIVKRLGTAPQ